jgi:Gpi18-like mannosyltransferase
MKQFLVHLSNRHFFLYLSALGLMGIILRIYFLQFPGFDDIFWHPWGLKLLEVGVKNAYVGNPLPNYAPVYLYILSGIAQISANLFHADPSTQTFITIQKSLNVLCDLTTTTYLVLTARRLFNDCYALAIGALWLLNPYVGYNSSAWGQVDSFTSLFMVMSFYYLVRENLLGLYVALVLGILFKAQFALFIPLVLLFALLQISWKRHIVPAAIALCAGLAILSPFIFNHSAATLFSETYVKASSYFPYLSLSAQNIWWFFVDTSSIISVTNTDTTPLLLGMSAKVIGLLAFSLMYAVALFTLIRPKKATLTDLAFSASLAYLSFYCLNTEMHERYLYPFFALWLLTSLSPSNKIGTYLILSLTQTISLILVCAVPSSLWFVRTHYFPQITYPMAYLNIVCLMALIYWAFSPKKIDPQHHNLVLDPPDQGVIPDYQQCP